MKHSGKKQFTKKTKKWNTLEEQNFNFAQNG